MVGNYYGVQYTQGNVLLIHSFNAMLTVEPGIFMS